MKINMANESELLNILNTSLVTRTWDNLYDNIDVKSFAVIKSGRLFEILEKIAEILTNENTNVPNRVKILLLKCLGNSCLNTYIHSNYESTEYGKYSKELYVKLGEDSSKCQNESKEQDSHPHNYFLYYGSVKWAIDHIIMFSNIELEEDQIQILRLSIQFLCNLLTFACNDISSLQCKSIRDYLNDTTFKKAIMKCICFKDISVSRATCMFIHNTLEKLGSDYFINDDKSYVCSQLLKKVKDLNCAKDAVLRLLNGASVFKDIYENILVQDKLYLLEIIYEEAQEIIYQRKECDTGFTFSHDLICFLSERFRRRSDLVLKTKDTYLNDVEPIEIIILLDILGVLTCEATDKLYILQKDKSLLINCCYLLKSLHMTGKESENYFTPIQRLSDIAPAMQRTVIKDSPIVNADVQRDRKNEEKQEYFQVENSEKSKQDIQCHPAFGFKVGLIRIIGNMSYKNEECQNIVRETDTIPLLLDCCNIDARNPLIMQWIIFAMRNLCEGNLQNQEVIRNCTKLGVVDNSILKEMGLTLHENEDGTSIGVVPLPREKNA